MRKTIFLLITMLNLNYGFSQHSEKTESKTYDPKLVGCWKGSEIGQQQEGWSKYWISCRFDNGSSTLLFVAIDKNGKVTQETENGKWWVENGNYYELHFVSGLTDIYKYEVSSDTVKFDAIEIMGQKNPNYSFIDTKIAED